MIVLSAGGRKKSESVDTGRVCVKIKVQGEPEKMEKRTDFAGRKWTRKKRVRRNISTVLKLGANKSDMLE